MRTVFGILTRFGWRLWHRVDGLSQPVLSDDEQREFTVHHSAGC